MTSISDHQMLVILCNMKKCTLVMYCVMDTIKHD